MEISRHSDTCLLNKVNSSKSEQVEVFSFSEQKSLTVVLNKSVKIPMIWNGKMYEGKVAGIDFTSDGPRVTKTTTGRN